MVIIKQIDDDTQYDLICKIMRSAHQKAEKEGLRFNTTSMSEKEIKDSLGDRGKVFFAEVDDELVGTLSYEIRKENRWYCRGGDVAIMRYMAVLPQYQGRGIAYHLMKHAIDDVRETDIVKLFTLKDNKKAINLYKKCGYKLAEIYMYNGHYSVGMILKKNKNFSYLSCKGHYIYCYIKSVLKKVIPKRVYK